MSKTDHHVEPLAEYERQYVVDVLRRTGGNKNLAARLLGVSRSTLYRMLEKYEKEQTK